jgi:flagellar biosynthetic protein FliR
MNELLEQLATDPWGRLVLHYMVTGGVTNSYVCLLVAMRLTGVFVLAPIGTANVIPLFIRSGLVVLLSLVIAPTLCERESGSGEIRLIAHKSAAFSLPETVADLACQLAREIGLGALLGVGVLAVLGGLRLGGEWLDRHGGLGPGGVLNPDWSGGASAGGSLVQMAGIAAFLLNAPMGGQSLVLQTIVQSFHALPVGVESWDLPLTDLVCGIVQQSLVLGLRVAMPLLVTMLLVDVTLAFITRNNAQLLSSPSLAIRAAIGVIVLGLTVTALPDIVMTTVASVIHFLEGIY